MTSDDHSTGPPANTAAFNAPHVVSYAEGPPRQVPGFSGLHRMTSMLLAERVPAPGRVLVLGAGGGLELKALADDHPGWTFSSVDPSADMLRVAEQIVGSHAKRIHLDEGYIDAAPVGPFDGAVCLLTLHFVPRGQRVETLRQIHRRLLPGAPFVVAHISFPQTEPSDRRGSPVTSHSAESIPPMRRAPGRLLQPGCPFCRRKKTKHSCVKQGSRTSACFTQALVSEAGWDIHSTCNPRRIPSAASFVCAFRWNDLHHRSSLI